MLQLFARVSRQTVSRSFSTLNSTPPLPQAVQLPTIESQAALDLKTATDLSLHSTSSLAASLMNHAPSIKDKSMSHKPMFDKVSKEILQRNLKRMKEDEMTTVLCTYATLGVKDVRLFEKLGEEISNRDLRRFQLSNLTKILHAHSRFRAKNLNLYLALSRELGNRDLSSLQFADTAALLLAFAVLQLRVMKICSNVSKVIKSKTIGPEVSPETMSNMLLGFAELNYKDKDLCALFAGETAKRNLEEFSVQDLINLLFAFAKLDHRDNGTAVMVERITQELLLRRFRKFTFGQLAQFMWALACLDALQLQSAQELFTTKQIRNDSYREKSTSIAMQVFETKLAWAQQTNNSSSSLLDSMFQESWMMPMVLAQGYNRHHHEVHREIAAMLKLHYPHVESNKVTVLGGLGVDILLPSHKAIVQTDNAKRYFSNHSLIKNGSALFRERLLERAGYEVISISEERFDQSDEEEREILIKSIVRTIARRG